MSDSGDVPFKKPLTKDLSSSLCKVVNSQEIMEIEMEMKDNCMVLFI